MGILVWLIVGGVVGWLASIVMRTDAQQGILLNVVVGIVGALLAGFVVSPLLGIGTINQGISVATFLVSLVGAIILLAIVNLFRRGPARKTAAESKEKAGQRKPPGLFVWTSLSRYLSLLSPYSRMP
jgi:uncharacterized membrane protein YeaQ/YmgE (transglycosylase-associated protein family)